MSKLSLGCLGSEPHNSGFILTLTTLEPPASFCESRVIQTFPKSYAWIIFTYLHKNLWDSPGTNSRNVLFCHFLYFSWIPVHFIDPWQQYKYVSLLHNKTKPTNHWKTGTSTVKLAGNSNRLLPRLTRKGCMHEWGYIHVAFGIYDSWLCLKEKHLNWSNDD